VIFRDKGFVHARWFTFAVVAFLITAFLGKRYVFHTPTQFLTGAFTEAGAMSLYLSDLSFLLLLVLWIAQGGWKRVSRALWPAAALVGWALLRTFWTDLPLLALYHTVRLAQGVLLAAITVQAVTAQKQRDAILVVIVLVGSLEALLGIGQVALGHSVGIPILGEPLLTIEKGGVAKVDLHSGKKLLRAYGTLPHPNILGGVLVATLLATGVLAARAEERWHPALALLFGMQGAGLLLTFSRSAYFAMLLTIFIVYYTIVQKLMKRGLLRDFSLALSLTVLILFFFPSIREAFLSRASPPPSDQFVEERIRTAREALETFRAHTFVGVGPGQTLPTLVERVPVGTSLEPWQYEYPHNVPLVIATELGVIGLGLFIFLFVVLVSKCRPSLRLGVAFLPFLPPLLFDHYPWTIHPGRILFWGSLGIVVGLFLKGSGNATNQARGLSPTAQVHPEPPSGH
jgi:O-antigen ligase/polysaccharide polymerase Wzy-like membrane protein